MVFYIIVRAARQNARTKQAILDDAASREGTRQNKVDIDEAPAIVDEAPKDVCAQPKSRRNKRNVVR
jgi:hypothetical protein